jgi:biopolymer transport protein ExbB
MKKILLIVFGLLVILPQLFAQAKEEALKDSSNQVPNIIQQGGSTLIVLFALSFCFVVLVIYLLLTLRKSVTAPEKFLTESEVLAKSQDLERLKQICTNNSSPAAKIIGAAVEEIILNPKVSYEAVRDAVEDEGSRQAGELNQKLQYLMDIAVVAPMIGLLGTVLGMREAFAGLRVDIGTANPVNLADGVSKALITTAAGLILGITAMFFHSYFRGRVHNLLSNLENCCAKILRLCVKNRHDVE